MLEGTDPPIAPGPMRRALAVWSFTADSIWNNWYLSYFGQCGSHRGAEEFASHSKGGSAPWQIGLLQSVN
jgi:hypothetical protein